jgi:hypothetical protein
VVDDTNAVAGPLRCYSPVLGRLTDLTAVIRHFLERTTEILMRSVACLMNLVAQPTPPSVLQTGQVSRLDHNLFIMSHDLAGQYYFLFDHTNIPDIRPPSCSVFVNMILSSTITIWPVYVMYEQSSGIFNLLPTKRLEHRLEQLLYSRQSIFH